MYFVINDMDDSIPFCDINGVCMYIKSKLEEKFNLDCISEEEKNLYLASVDGFFHHSMEPELTPFFDKYDCYLSDLFSVYKQTMLM